MGPVPGKGADAMTSDREESAQSEPASTAALWPVLPRAIQGLPREVRFRAENSLEGFARARTLLPIDREMASFRAITAEEEAAAALFRSLQLRKYPGADQLSLKLHQHKAAAPFFLAAVQHALVHGRELRVSITLHASPPSVTVALPLDQFVTPPPDLPDLHIQLAEPLGILSTKPGVSSANYFDAAVAKVAGDRKVDKLITAEANARNRILYAHDAGLPISRANEASIDIREGRARALIILAIAVLQTETHQPLAVQCLAGFLKVVGRAQPEIFT